MIALALLSACSTAPTVTDEGTLVGRLLDSAGQPLADVEINSIEGKYRTGPDGTFAVPIEPPSELVHFIVDGVYYQRLRLDKDLDTAVDVTLPERQALTLTCPPTECDLSLTWRFDAAMSAKLIPTCEPGGSVEFAAVPTAMPNVSCREGRGKDAVDYPMTAVATPGTWTIRESGADVTVAIVDAEGTAAPNCEVRIGRNTIEAGEDGSFVGRADGPTTITATCDGRPAQPVRFDPATTDDRRVTLQWSPAGPTVDLGSIAPWAKRVVVRSADRAWEVSAEVGPDGILALPPLLAGQYTVYVKGASGSITAEPTEPINAPDVLSFQAAEDEFWIGRLNLQRAVSSGALETHVAPPR